jgi:hypothetical protein
MLFGLEVRNGAISATVPLLLLLAIEAFVASFSRCNLPDTLDELYSSSNRKTEKNRTNRPPSVGRVPRSPSARAKYRASRCRIGSTSQ